MPATGVDVGTNRLVSATTGEDGNVIFKSERDAFYRIVPKSEVLYSPGTTGVEKLLVSAIFYSVG